MLHCCVATNVLHMQHSKMLHAPCNINYTQRHSLMQHLTIHRPCNICNMLHGCKCCCNTVACCRLMQQNYTHSLTYTSELIFLEIKWHETNHKPFKILKFKQISSIFMTYLYMAETANTYWKSKNIKIGYGTF